MKFKIENNKTSYPLISVSNSILVNFMNLATDIGSFIDTGRLFHNTDPLKQRLIQLWCNPDQDNEDITNTSVLHTTLSVTLSVCLCTENSLHAHHVNSLTVTVHHLFSETLSLSLCPF